MIEVELLHRLALSYAVYERLESIQCSCIVSKVKVRHVNNLQMRILSDCSPSFLQVEVVWYLFAV